MEQRKGFKKMIRHALEGKIDMIICKSISRFARNVLDALNIVRKLKEKGVQVVFERENIKTGNMQSEFILTMLAATAQEESRSISENVTWSYEKRFQQGEPVFTRMLGYKKDKDNNWIVIDEEAKIVREAFEQCLQGRNPAQIAKSFIRKGYQKVNDRTDWSALAVRDILKNERYTGDVLCRKYYVQNHLGKRIANDGSKTQYLIYDHHEAIIEKEIYEKVQEKLMEKTKKKPSGKRKRYSFSGRSICGYCGGKLQRFICRGIVTWRCGTHTKSKNLCAMTGIREEMIVKAMIRGFMERYQSRDYQKKQDLATKLIEELQGVNSATDSAYNQIRLELERILYKENLVVLNPEVQDKDGQLKALNEKRTKIEEQMAAKEAWWILLEEDSEYRQRAIETLENLRAVKVSLKELKEHLNNNDFLRAWVVRVKALSPISFSLNWFDGEETLVEFNEGVEGR
ncbi:recombinase family protein [Heliorestis convoluta]|uniref:Recombinase family protein n=1 Tax=Heliorestis convoluta TaxID=356322 RepID=A0A5Q2N0N7_9FIRM|nr:recombinase family protein [Heliorestis convoluta]